MVGPHVQAFAEELIQEPFIDHCVIGEYEIPSLEIVEKLEKAKPIYEFQHLDDIDFLQGDNFLPYRPLEYLHNYWDPSMGTPRSQLQVNSSRGCPYKCTYCQWPKVMNNGQFRTRSPELVIEEIQTVILEHREYLQKSRSEQTIFNKVKNALSHVGSIARRVEGVRHEIGNALHGPGEIRSIFFDDDTWNLGKSRIEAFCRGLREIGLPWTMMGRTDACQPDLYDVMVDSGCVGMRFGIESFNQRLLDNTKKKMDAKKNYDTIKYLITRFENMEFHFTTMKNLPGETEQDWLKDLEIFNELKELGERSNNIIHWQTSDCIAFPGTELWEELVAMGKGGELRNFELFDGSSGSEENLGQTIGRLGENYSPRLSEYSKMGEPTDIPKD